MGKKTELDRYGIYLDQNQEETVALKTHTGANLIFRTHKEMADLAHALLAALGEPVEPKPDRSELDAVEGDRWLVVRNDSIVSRHGRMATLEALIDSVKKRPGGGTIYESQAWVEPEPADRKVVQVQ